LKIQGLTGNWKKQDFFRYPGQPLFLIHMSIILISGPKHSGKTLCAEALGALTGIKTVDLDTLIEDQTGKSPRELFKEGNEIFRKAEARALSSLLQGFQGAANRHLIVAAGGGLVDNPDAMTLLAEKKEIRIIYLDVSAETAWQRILRSAEGSELPPFLRTENPRETHRALHERRVLAYKALAHVSISAENKSPREIAGEIIKLLKL